MADPQVQPGGPVRGTAADQSSARDSYSHSNSKMLLDGLLSLICSESPLPGTPKPSHGLLGPRGGSPGAASALLWGRAAFLGCALFLQQFQGLSETSDAS